MDSDTRLVTRSPDTLSGTVNDEASLGTLVTQLAQDSSTLIKQEIALAKAEVRESVGLAANGAAKLGVAVALLAVGGLVLTAFLVLLLGDLLDNYWVAALIIGVLFTIIGAVLALGGIQRLKSVQLTPARTIETLKDDKAWAQSEIGRVRNDLKANSP